MNAFTKTLAAASVMIGLASVAQAETTEINFGIISTESQQNLKPQWDPFLAAMEAQTGLKINAFYASDYAGVIEGMRFGKVQAAWFGNKSAMEAVDRAGGEVFAQTVDVAGNPGYWGVLLAHKDSAFNSLQDVLKCDKSLNFGIGDPNSTSGFLVPMTFVFAANGVDPKTCFKTVRNANHETNALAVANKQVDVAANNTENLTRIEEGNPKAFANLKVIWKSPLIPADPLVWKSDLDSAAKQKLMTFIMSYGRIGTPAEVAEARKVMAGLKWAPFRPSSNAQLYPIRVMEFTKEEFRVQADDKLSADEKKAKLAELAAKKAEVEKLLAEVPQL